MKSKLLMLLIVGGFLSLLMTACEDNPVVERPVPTPTTMELRVAQSNEFGCDLYNHLRTTEGNLLVAPHSITTVFGMAYAGARGTTEREMATALRFEYPPVNFHSTLQRLNDLLQSRGLSVGPDNFRLLIANSAWGKIDYPFLPEYVDTLATHYGAELQLMDFAGHPEEARLTMNKWAFDHTDGLISDLIPPGLITPITPLALINTIYFRAAWLHQYDTEATRPEPFHRLDGSTVNAAIMSGEEFFEFRGTNGYKAIAFPYKEQKCEMFVLLPNEGRFYEFEDQLTTARLDSIRASLQMAHVTVDFPRFSFRSTYRLETVLQDMGMTEAFGGNANFSGIDGTDDGSPWIDFVAHQTFINVNEWGTLAAAGTVMGFTVGESWSFDAVRPFIFLIRDVETGTILFMGRVLDPTAS
jgi:serpin B